MNSPLYYDTDGPRHWR